jgi:tetratricopeptide (TPR) repeat protein
MSDQSLAQLDLEGLEAYFTDVEYLREIFKTLVAAPALPKRLLIIHGVGGVGKSSLLRMFRLHCKRESVPVGLASGDEAKSAVDVLVRWTSDLEVEGIKLPTFTKTAEHHRAIQAKVEEQVRKAKEIRDNAAGALGKAAAKTIIETAVSAIPVVGPLISGLSGMGTEALVDWLGSFLRKPDIDLLLDPTKALTDDFLVDLDRVAHKQRLVLMLDTFEQMSVLEDWTRDLAQRLHPNVLLVIAGRAVPNWSRQWPSWLALAEVHELKPMTELVMRELISRYYATMRGGEPNPAQVEAILSFARGLPIVVTSAVQLWVEYGVEDFQAIKPQVMADLVDRLQEGVPQELVPILEAAAAVRWFNKDILRVVTGQGDVSAVYDELRRFPFTRPRAEGLGLHDVVREIMDENLRVHNPDRHCQLHEYAAKYFETSLAKKAGQDFEQLSLERLYHRISAIEEEGIQLFQEMAEELVRHRLYNRLRILLKDINTYPLIQKNSCLWREYYNTWLMAEQEGQRSETEKIFESISKNEQADAKLRGYAFCELGRNWTRRERLGKPGAIEKALGFLEYSQKLVPSGDPKLVFIVTNLRKIYNFRGEWEKGLELLEKELQLFEQNGDKYGVVFMYSLIKDSYGLLGNWKKADDTLSQAMRVLETLPESPRLRARLIGNDVWHFMWSGRLIEAEQGIREGIDLAEAADTSHNISSRSLGLVLGLQGKYKQASKYLGDTIKRYEQRSVDWVGGKWITLSFWGVILKKQGELEKAEECLSQSLSYKREVNDNTGIPEVASWLGELHEIKANYAQPETKALELFTAESYFNQSLKYRWSKRRYFETGAITGLVRIKYAQADYPAIPPLLTEAEQLAQQYEYNDHLASLRLTQGHITGDGYLPEWGSGFKTALRYYQHTLIHALRYNRFLLDEVLWGGGVCTPLRPIIPHCQERGDEGRQMLTALRDWWQAGANDIGVARPDTISPIPEGISLLEAEQTARQREPGDGSLQKMVLEQLEAALGD